MLAARIDSFKPVRRSYNEVMSYGDGRPRVGISRCLLGDEVRYDGGHKLDGLLISTLGSLVQWVPVCPEVEAGMGTPREAIHLVASDDGVAAGAARVRVLGVTSRTDWTATMVTFSTARVQELIAEHLDGYVLKSDSPSCGLEQVRVHGHGPVSHDGRGLFAEALLRALPDLPVEEERRLRDSAVRENFIHRVFEHWRLRKHG